MRTGLTPDGQQGPPVLRASWFRSPQAELEALRRGQRGFAADDKAGQLPEPPATPTGDPLYHEVPVRTNDPRGFGNSAVARRQAPPSNTLDKDAAGNRVAVPSSTVLPGASIRYKYDDAAKKWHLVSGFPEADPLPGGQPNLR